MHKLSSNQLQEYNDNGYVAPIEVLTKYEAFEVRKEIENIETRKKANDDLQRIFYPGSTQKRDL